MSSIKTSLSSWRSPAIVPRKRTVEEQRDLAVRLIGKLFKSLAFYYGVLAAPVYLLNCALWLWFFNFTTSSTYDVSTALFNGFIVWVTISFERQFVGSLVTQYLGQWLFSATGRLTKRQIFQLWRERFFQVFYYLVLTRFIRLRAYYPEIILLERTPFWGSKQVASTSKRAAMINAGGIRGTALSTGFANEIYLFSGVISGYATLTSLVNTIFPEPNVAILIVNFVVFPIFLFGCKLFNVVFEFCSYINFRISYEGWDVDLAFRTETLRLGGEEDELASEHVARRRAPARSRTLEPLVMENAPVTGSLESVEFMQEGASR